MFLRIKNLLALLVTNPEMGSPSVRASLIAQYGEGLRKVHVSSFVKEGCARRCFGQEPSS